MCSVQKWWVLNAPGPKKAESGKILIVNINKTVTWLNCETEFEGGKRLLRSWNAEFFYAKFRARITGRRTFNEHWISVPNSISTSNIHYHSQSDQHICATLSCLTLMYYSSNKELKQTHGQPYNVHWQQVQNIATKAVSSMDGGFPNERLVRVLAMLQESRKVMPSVPHVRSWRCCESTIMWQLPSDWLCPHYNRVHGNLAYWPRWTFFHLAPQKKKYSWLAKLTYM